MSRTIQTPRPGAQLETELGIKGAIKLRLDEIVTPVIQLQPRARRYATGSIDAAAAVGFRSEVALVNVIAVGVGVLDQTMQVHRIVASTDVADFIDIVHTSAGIVGFTEVTTSKGYLNFPEGVAPAGVLGWKNTAAGTAGPVIYRVKTQAGIPVVIDLPWPVILGPPTGLGNTTLLVRPGSDNVQIIATIVWSEPSQQA